MLDWNNLAIKCVKEYTYYDSNNKRLLDGELIYSIDTQKVYTAINNKMVELFPSQENTPPKLSNCRNCGAPVKGYKCEYCGTKY